MNTTFRLWHYRQVLVDSSLVVHDLEQSIYQTRFLPSHVPLIQRITYQSCVCIIEYFYLYTGDGPWQEFDIMPCHSESKTQPPCMYPALPTYCLPQPSYAHN